MKKTILSFLYWCLFGLLALWSAGIVYYCAPGEKWLVFLYITLVLAGIVFRKRKYVPGGLWGIIIALNLFFLSISPSNERPWKASWSELPMGVKTGNMVIMDNIRHFHYRTPEDFDVEYKTERYDLDKLETLDFAVCHWDGMEAVAHTMLSFGFGEGRYLALSAETRLAEGDIQGSLPGLYKQFGFQFIFAKEEDIFALRSNFRHEDLYLYRVRIPRENIRLIFEDFVKRANRLVSQPEFYNTLTHNCTSGLLPSVCKGVRVAHYNPAILLNGFIDRRMFRLGGLEHKEGESFEDLKARARIPYDISKDEPGLYSRKIREKAGILPEA